MISFILRTLLFTFLRFFLLIALVFLTQSFEVSPLPEWTLYVFVFLMQFFVTCLCAMWAIRRQLPRTKEWIILLICFLLLETVFEVQLSLLLSGGGWGDLSGIFSGRTLIPLASYFIAVSLAVQYKRKKILQAHLPEGVNFNQ